MSVTAVRESRVPERVGAGHLAALDGLRTVAILLVVFTHAATITGYFPQSGLFWSVLSNGTVGVPIFFVLSGMLLYRPWAKALVGGGPGPDVRAYFRRRALRILPGYWVMVVVGLLLFSRAHVLSPRFWGEMLTLTQWYDLHPWWGQTDVGPPQLGPMWSLSVEVAFYLVLPLLAWMLGRGARRFGDRWVWGVLAALTVGSVAVTFGVRTFLSYRWIFYWEHVLPRSLPLFLAGMALALVVERARQTGGWAERLVTRVGEMPGVCWTISFCALVLVATPLATPVASGQTAMQCMVMIVLQGVVAVALVAPVAFRPEQPMIKAVLGNEVMVNIGLVSYGVFLWHHLVLGLWYQVTGRPQWGHDFLLVFSVTLGGGLVMAALSYHLIEKPALRWK